MSVVYTICHVEQFLRKDKYTCSKQTVLEGTEDSPDSNYKLVNQNFAKITLDNNEYSIAKYLAYQDVKQNKYGRQFGKFFYWYLEPHEFPFYLIEELNLIIMTTGKNTTDSFLRQMKEDKESGLIFKRHEVDFKKTLPLVEVVNGVWFCDMQKKKQYINSAALFGHNVDKSEEFKDAMEAGIISSLSLPYSYDGKDIQLMITKNGAIVIQGRIKNPVSKEPDLIKELTLSLNLYLSYLK